MITVKVKWNLHVQFIVAADPRTQLFEDPTADATLSVSKAKSQVAVSPVDWYLPLKIYPTHPENCHSAPTRKELCFE